MGRTLLEMPVIVLCEEHPQSIIYQYPSFEPLTTKNRAPGVHRMIATSIDDPVSGRKPMIGDASAPVELFELCGPSHWATDSESCKCAKNGLGGRAAKTSVLMDTVITYLVSELKHGCTLYAEADQAKLGRHLEHAMSCPAFGYSPPWPLSSAGLIKDHIPKNPAPSLPA
ncbi:hypothetical protein SODALDRAFT_360625 [Sodiomyces alkalinus F11]|uniref:Uncharacterized protein n=1 Tax=Sodiomyces alkalinus (strain CBS 110278 / VKM F-3762 / F11) TaxID=1314773 RepID=A0A3N2PUT8_SODAK|nr:hypothetical protein SODALDRAFT_360625 [Sodiomyces alkalinus F11]ROT38273.1 hypothetical protein SODALDRAFT_360625 [Sodiomyces alkalinus F11]